MFPNNKESIGESSGEGHDGYERSVTNQPEEAIQSCLDNILDDTPTGPSNWWLFSTAFPMMAGTLGPVAAAFSICSMVEPWRQELVPGEDVQDAPSVADPSWLLIIEAIQLLVGVIANLVLLLNMAKRVQFNVALPITIVGWYGSSFCRITLTAVIARPLKNAGLSEDTIIWSQSFYYGMWAAILYFIDASLVAITFWGAYAGHYRKALSLNNSERTLMLQSIMLLVYLLLGAYIFSEVESWPYLDAVYWAVVTLFTVGFGDYYPTTELGRALLIPFALAGIISLGLVIGSVRNLIVENGSQRMKARIGKRRREKIVRKISMDGSTNALEPIHDEPQTHMAVLYGTRQIYSEESSGVGNFASDAKNTRRALTGKTNEMRCRFAYNDTQDLSTIPATTGPAYYTTGPQNTYLTPLSALIPNENPNLLAAEMKLQLLLISEIQTVTHHLQEPQPHQYTFDQWAWYLKLLGEDEQSPRTHCGANLADDQRLASQGCFNSDLRWSWIGERSPLLSNKQESAWILDGLIARLKVSLLSVEKLRVDNTGGS
ncbi:hypothetical protein ACLX1H_003102 [Fusarium chlamydosporum]